MRKWTLPLSKFRKLSFNDKKSYMLGYLFNTRDSGETVINCRSELITKEEIDKVLNILHSDYKDLGMTISLHNSKYYTFIKLLNPLYKSIDLNTFKGAFNGVFAANHTQGRIDLFPYNHEANQHRNVKLSIKFHIVYDLLHEVRHAYQLKHKENKYIECIKNYSHGGESGYSKQWVERDANSFATRIMNKHHDEINEILGIDYEWENTWGYFRRLRGIETRKYKRAVPRHTI